MSFANILTWSYWFYQPYIARGGVMWIWVGGFLALVLAGLLIKIFRNYQQETIIKEAYRRGSNLLLSMGLAGLLWMFFRQERVSFLAWRFWLLLWLVIFIWWGVKVIIYFIKRLPKIKEEKIKIQEVKKYLPGKKR
ncbi:MAG: hypothetical protein US58_C0012G0062 [Candidatus Magasanikbacteria bacterium GW2011_GWA2_37_8]|uniref:Uncharacterized protein n=1 Tax=Candidatus Magasanikbacteria bacterium GW2011_GWA2_37_8 TaxID=1619036 RepID=A0A0G0HCE1_9BACT|nr:MAG: hypothetical protein US58_C0012G0062 [Candidatus Magasanikbacteria bacterium GW2011_GWA2_37_8]